jgi:RNA polymerase sigma factor (TIGR02999 family)
MPSNEDITGLLVEWCDGDQTALERLVPVVESELRRLAHNYMNHERAGHLLQTTALVNEAYIRLVRQDKVRWQNRAHFFAIAAQTMRRILLNYARDQKRAKRGGGAIQVSLQEVAHTTSETPIEIIALDDALKRLSAIDERKGRIVELRYFGGLSIEETAEVLGIAPITVIRNWNMAKAWLAREIRDGA